MSNISFPNGINWGVRYVTGGDFLTPDIKINGSGLYRYSKNNIIDVKADLSSTTQPTYMFANSSVKFINNLQLPDITSGAYMFDGCSNLIIAPQISLGSGKSEFMFQNCNKLIYVPHFDLSQCSNTQSLFTGCTRLSNIPATNFAASTSVNTMFSYCTLLDEIPDMDFSSLTNFGASAYNTWLYGASYIRSIGVLKCDSITNITYVLGGSANYRLTHLGGFRNLGKAKSVSGTDGAYFLAYAPNLTRQSLINVFNELYDRASAGLSVLTLKLHANHRAILSDEDKAIATNKGWTLS